ncbi:MAG TPA: multicopper oxidase domain-containing protein [Candidatus Saccharimonadales bacterium]|nr:multicopper oxidase domain-containing protein [Candidatus Saccharimonadales bacterium]
MDTQSSRRDFLRTAGLVTGLALSSPRRALSLSAPQSQSPADYTLRIQASAIEIAPKRIVSAVTYNGQFPGPLLRFKQGQPVTIDVFNDTDTPEQLHWHGQFVPVDVDGAAEEGTPYIPAHGLRRLNFTPNPSGFRFYHTHNRAGANLSAGQYSGQVGPVYIEPISSPGDYDREVFLTLKEFEPAFSRGGDMDMNFLAPDTRDKSLESVGEAAMKASLAKGMPHGFEVGYNAFTINGRMLGHGDPIRVKSGERLLLHILNGSATEIRSLALPGHTFEIVALDGNPVPTRAKVPVLWLGTAERISAFVTMNHPGVWILGDLADDDRHHGMGIVVEYANQKSKPLWTPPPPFKWNYLRFATPGAPSPHPDETIDMLFAKQNAAHEGFNLWTINGVAFPMSESPVPASFHLRQGRRYRIRLRNQSDDIHPIHLHRHSFELRQIAGVSAAGIKKDVVMLGGYQQAEIDFVADNPGLSLFHCHQQLHMDFGFMTLFDYV